MSSPPVVHRRYVAARSRILSVWERYRNRPGLHYVMELIAEAMGVFFLVYPGLGAAATLTISTILGQKGASSIFQIGCSYSIGAVIGLSICSATSGHINPAMTMCLTIFRGFPIKKAPGYILAQIFGAYLAAVLVYYQYEPFILKAETTLKEAGLYDQLLFTPEGIAGIFAVYMPPEQTYKSIIINEFMSSCFIGLALWAFLDPSNGALCPPGGTFVVALAYAVNIWAFGFAGIALHTARDVGTRLMAMMFWGGGALGGPYAAIAAFTNIAATFTAACIYELFFVDSDRVIPQTQMEHARIMSNHRRFGQNRDLADQDAHQLKDLQIYEWEIARPRRSHSSKIKPQYSVGTHSRGA